MKHGTVIEELSTVFRAKKRRMSEIDQAYQMFLSHDVLCNSGL